MYKKQQKQKTKNNVQMPHHERMEKQRAPCTGSNPPSNGSQKRPGPNDNTDRSPPLDAANSTVPVVTRLALIIRNLKVHLFRATCAIIRSMIPHGVCQPVVFIRVQFHLLNNIATFIIHNSRC